MDGVSEIIAQSGGTDVICDDAPRETRARHGYYRTGTD